MKTYQYASPTILLVTGKHAERYCNARLSNDIRLCASNQAIEAACLNAQGRVLAYFTVLRTESGYLLYCTGGERNQVISAFKQFIVADQVDVKDVSDQYQLWHVFGNLENIGAVLGSELPNKFLAAEATNSHIYINRPRTSFAGLDLLININSIYNFQQLKNTQVDSAEFNYQRIAAKQLSYPEELDENYMFAESGMTHAISNKKGCYAGQEAIEMLSARGEVPSKIFKVSAEGSHQLVKGTSIFSDPSKNERIGSVLSAYFDVTSNSTLALVKIRNKFSEIQSVYMLDQNFSVI